MATSVNAPLYTLDILRLAAESPDREPLFDPDGSAEKRAPLCGSRVRVEVKVDAEGRVTALSQYVVACAFGQASATLMNRHAVGRNLGDIRAALTEFSDWLAGRRDNPGDWPGLDYLTPARTKTARHGAMLLPFEALKAAVEAATQ